MSTTSNSTTSRPKTRNKLTGQAISTIKEDTIMDRDTERDQLQEPESVEETVSSVTSSFASSSISEADSGCVLASALTQKYLDTDLLSFIGNITISVGDGGTKINFQNVTNRSFVIKNVGPSIHQAF